MSLGHRPGDGVSPGEYSQRAQAVQQGRPARKPRPQGFHLAEDTRYHAFPYIFKHKGEVCQPYPRAQVLEVRLEMAQPVPLGSRPADEAGAQGVKPLVKAEPQVDKATPGVADPLGKRFQPVLPELQQPLSTVYKPRGERPESAG